MCADLFRAHRDEIDGVLVTLPNFGDERAMANVLRWRGLDVPVLIHAFPDDPQTMSIADRRDSFCGKMASCNNLWQYGIPYSLTVGTRMAPRSPVFAADLRAFAATCRVVRACENVRVGVLGARPANFNTVRFSEKLMEQPRHQRGDARPFGSARPHCAAGGRRRQRSQAKIGSHSQAMSERSGDPRAALVKMAKFGVVVDDWMNDDAAGATAIQCWTAMEEYFGVVPCTLMSMMSNSLMPSACETDMIGMVGDVRAATGRGRPSAIVDWNNNYGDDPDKGVIFHCSNLPKDFFVD